MTNLKFQSELFESNKDVNNGVKQEALSGANDAWLKFLEIVKLNVSDLKFNTWFKPIRAKSIENNTLLISVPSQDYYEMIISRFGDIISRSLKMILGEEGRLVYEIEKEIVSEDISAPDEEQKIYHEQSPGLFENALKPIQHEPEKRTPAGQFNPASFLNPEYTFENFVKGKNNEFATAAALSISNRPGAQYNPIMIYGGVGLGKTHLMQAIGNHLIGKPGRNKYNVRLGTGVYNEFCAEHPRQ